MRVVIWILAILLTLATVSGAAFYWFSRQLGEPHAHDMQSKVITINRGASTEEVLATLKQNGIIDDDFALKIYLKVTRKNALIKAGDYRFPSPITQVAVLDELARGGTEHNRITVVEGWTRFDVAKAMKAIPTLKLASQKDAEALVNDVSLIATTDPAATSLEGYLFPDTYFVEADTTAASLVSQMVKRFKTVYDEKLENDALKSGLSTHQIVTVASIVETEAKLSEERPIVASVIYNRLRRSMRLSMDSTIVYASKLAGKWRDDGKVYQSDLDRDSPYNTRLYKGLPPGPVSCPGLSSLTAAVSPSHTDYLYYVRNPKRNDGAHNYYSNVADFEKGVEALRAWEKDQRRKGLR